MYEHLKGKTLLIMDRTALAACAVVRAKEMGIRTVVANFYKTEDSPSKQVADIAIDIDISNIDAMVSLIKEYQIDGVFVGWTDSHLPYYARICEKAGLPCCGTEEQFDVLSNDKRRFKETCLKYGVPTPETYDIDMDFRREVLDRVVYPVMVKPADGSGGRGIKKCMNESELITHYTALYNSSASKKIICEQYMGDENEVFIHYTVQGGYCSLSCSSYGWKLLVAKLLDTVYTDLRSLIIGKMYSPNDLAFYNRGKQFPHLIVTNINTTIDSVLLPTLSAEQDNVSRVRELTRRAIKISTYIMMPMMVGLAVCAEPLVRLVLTDKWLPAVPFLRVFCFTYAIRPVSTANLNAIKALGRSDLFLKLEIIKKVHGRNRR